MAEPIFVDVRFEVMAEDAMEAEELVLELAETFNLPEDASIISVAASEEPTDF